MESKITPTKHNTKEELYELFINGTPLPGIKITNPETSKEKVYHKPFYNVLANNRHIIEANQDFNGEPFIRGNFEYMQVLLPEYRLKSMYMFYPVLNGILNGYHVCTKADKDCLTALANQIYHYYAPIKHVYRQTQERIDSFRKIEDIIDNVIATPYTFKGRVKHEPILWNPDYDLTKQEKIVLCNKDSGKALLDNNLQTLLELYTKGMTKKELTEKAKLSKSTVYRRWDALIELYNQEQDFTKAA